MKSKVSIGLVNPKSPDNVGSVMRAAGNYRVDRVFFTGERYLRALEFQVQAVNTGRQVGRGIPISKADCLLNEAPENMKIVCIEFAENAISLPKYQHPEQALYIFGSEDGTISQDIIDKADAVVYVPTVGCMNLAATVNVVLYDRMAKSTQRIESNELIRASRDRNNTLKVF
ncbi:TrmH family RNA methyltransferase [methanotrophic endosymbiont of Bathymodiolus puteoserpentis (Logatchev)]|jgi:tRNA(Leu) C34 or U34 (ribose-2'-O)-methylase TrmL|uniref:TrmH family RNA methyltransferase n=1 Tax=methanotrophic endosymbiont of Bathymodiolus puteoserpentis (Logatchev) TaxID=343235 RepID=UPI0013CB7076|nr:TrmH family RNA methyltransferase [methanotrophic endosymbiont of Bathymodiolus puteoserpentis (Logatchev)]SHE23775.1 tRNA (guanosine(18)-2'-O)-methyltransferase [methanotrophic endosymbiont of Bathymodiolus puteoserpentis (Logatchev)]